MVKNQPMAVSEREMKKLAEFGDFVVYFVLFLFFSALFLFNKEFSFVDCIQIRVVTGQRAAVISALVACPSLCLCLSFTAQNFDPPTFHQDEIVKLTMRCRSPN